MRSGSAVRAAAVLFAVATGGGLLPVVAVAAEPLEVDVTVDPGDGGSLLKALTVQLTYPKDGLSLPGSGGADSVRERVRLVPSDPGKDDLLMVNDDDASATLRIVYVHQPLTDEVSVGKGALVHVRFDRGGAAGADAIRCAVVGASDQTGRTIDGVQCAVQTTKQ